MFSSPSVYWCICACSTATQNDFFSIMMGASSCWSAKLIVSSKFGWKNDEKKWVQACSCRSIKLSNLENSFYWSENKVHFWNAGLSLSVVVSFAYFFTSCPFTPKIMSTDCDAKASAKQRLCLTSSEKWNQQCSCHSTPAALIFFCPKSLQCFFSHASCICYFSLQSWRNSVSYLPGEWNKGNSSSSSSGRDSSREK